MTTRDPCQEHLCRVAARFRKAMESVPKEDFEYCGSWCLSLAQDSFPHGCCGDTGALLRRYLQEEEGVLCDCILGEYGGREKEILSHVWIQARDWVIDITADQFVRRGYDLPAVYVGERTDWYRSFSTRIQNNDPMPSDFFGAYKRVLQNAENK